MRMLFLTLSSVFFWASVLAQENTFFVRVDFDGNQDAAAAIIPADSGYIILGSGKVFDSTITRGITLAKLDEMGNILWRRGHGRAGDVWYQGLWGNVIQTQDGHFVFGGNSPDSSNFRDCLIMKFTDQGDTLWTREYRLEATSSLFDVVECQDGSLAFSGFLRYPENAGRDDYLLLKTDADGNLLWYKTYGWFFVDISTSLALTQDSGFLLGGGKNPFLGNQRTVGWLVKTDSLGQLEWDREYAGDFQKDNCGSDVWPIPGGGYYMLNCHDTLINPGDYQFANFISRLSESGDELWRTYLPNPYLPPIYALEVLPDTSVISVGYQATVPSGKEFIWLEKVGPQGDRIWSRRYSFQEDIGYIGTDLVQARDGGLLVTGFTREANQDMFLLKLDSLGCFTPGCDSLVNAVQVLPPLGRQLHLSPNPTRGPLRWLYRGLPQMEPLHLSLHNLQGQLVWQQQIQPSQPDWEWKGELPTLPAGLYLASLRQVGQLLGRRKVVVE